MSHDTVNRYRDMHGLFPEKKAEGEGGSCFLSGKLAQRPNCLLLVAEAQLLIVGLMQHM